MTITDREENGAGTFGFSGVEQMAIMQCLAVKVGKVWVAVRIALE